MRVVWTVKKKKTAITTGKKNQAQFAQYRFRAIALFDWAADITKQVMYLRYVIRLNTRSPAQYKVERNESKHRICHSPNNNILTIKINGSTNSYTRVYQHSCNTIDMYDIDCCADNAIGVGYKICCQVCYRSLHHSIQPILESGDLPIISSQWIRLLDYSIIMVSVQSFREILRITEVFKYYNIVHCL